MLPSETIKCVYNVYLFLNMICKVCQTYYDNTRYLESCIKRKVFKLKLLIISLLAVVVISFHPRIYYNIFVDITIQ